MRGERWTKGLTMACGLAAASGGCVSLSEYTRVKAHNRTLAAEKESLQQELFDERNVNDNLRTKVTALENEKKTQNELLTNLRGENELLDGVAKTALTSLEGIQKWGGLRDLTGIKLPGPLHSALKQFADAHPNEVIYDAANGTVKWKGDLLFPLGSDEVKSSSMEALRGLTEVLRSAAAEDFEVVVVGHTDNRPIQRDETRRSHPTNWHLSAHRAIAVGGVLQKNGYSAERIGVMGCGEYRPMTDNSTESGQSQNRRVEIYLIPRGTIVASGVARMSRPDSQPGVAQTMP